MPERNWGLITSGAMFEALVTTLIFFEDPRAALFGRPGKDGGQDARSGDGLLVYQAKHHEDGSAAKAIADAKREAENVAKYRQAGHARARQWATVTRWRLMTNANFNPTDDQRWRDEVEPLFAAQGLSASYSERRAIEALLDKHPEVDRAFFQSETRAFLTIPEKRERLPADEPFLGRATSAPFKGRGAESQAVRDFLTATESFLVVHGAGGIGKTRLLVEAGEEIAAEGEWQVLWANVATMSASGSWFEAVVPERPTLLLVDEPEDEELLRVLSEQLGGVVGRASKWKVVVAVRSPKDPVIRFLAAARMRNRVRWLPLGALSDTAAEDVCRELIASGPLKDEPEVWRNDIATKLARRFSRHPVWLTLAVHALETHGDFGRVPNDAATLADEYLDEVVTQQRELPEQQVRETLRWVALVRKVNRQDETVVELISQRGGIRDSVATLELLARLVERRVLTQRGAKNRFVEMKPDVLRDHVLLRWLAQDVGFGDAELQASTAAKDLAVELSRSVLDDDFTPVKRSILVSIARTELLLQLSGKPVALLDPFFEVVRAAIPQLGAMRRRDVIEALVHIAQVRVHDTVDISRMLRTSPTEAETREMLFGPHTVTNEDVLLSLAWPVYRAAYGAETLEERLEILNELVAIVEAETTAEPSLPHGLPNDGKRAAGVLSQAIAGGPYFATAFDDAAAEVAVQQLERLRTPATKPTINAVRAIVRPCVVLERQQTWVEGNTFTFRKKMIVPGDPGWDSRERVLGKIRALLEDDGVPSVCHVVLWDILADAHRLANYVALHGQADVKARFRAEFLGELQWTTALLQRRGGRFEEMSAARDLWEWHTKHEKDEETKAAAQRLEDLYLRNDLAKEFEPVLEFLMPDAFAAVAGEKAEGLLAAGVDGIEAFVERGVRFIADERKFFALHGVGHELGARAERTEVVGQFIERALSEQRGPQVVEFALAAAARWLVDRRANTAPPQVVEFVERLVVLCMDNATRTRLILALYGASPPRFAPNSVSADEQEYLRSKEELFRGEKQLPLFVGIVGPGLEHAWPAYQEQLARVLDELEEPATTRAVAALIQGVFWAVHERTRAEFPDDAGTWVLDQVVRVTDVGAFGSMTDFRLEKVMEVLGPVPLRWLPGALRRRAQLEHSDVRHRVRSLRNDSDLAEHVAKIEETQRDDAGVIGVVDSLLDFVDDQGVLGYRLAELLHEVDPHGFVVPGRIARRIREGDNDLVSRFARLARAYVDGTPQWREIARAVLERAAAITVPQDRRPLYNAVSRPSVESWSGVPGKVSEVFIHAVDRAKRLRDEETDHVFAPLWDWYVAVTEADLKRQEEFVREELEDDAEES